MEYKMEDESDNVGENGAQSLSKFIGRGIDLAKASGPYTNYLKRAILKIDKASEIVKTLPVVEGNIHYQSSESLSELYSSWNIEASVDITTPFFSGGFKADYSNNTRHESCNRFFKGIVSIKGFTHVLSPKEEQVSTNDALVDYLIKGGYVDPIALKNINGMPVAELFNQYGTHVVTGGLTGGCIQITAKYGSSTTVTEEKFSSTLKFACGYVTGESKGGFSDEQKKILTNVELNAVSRGGDPRIIGILHDYKAIPDTFEKWTASVTEDNFVMTDIVAAILIWEFCAKVDRRELIKSVYSGTNQKIFSDIENYFPSPKLKEVVSIYSGDHNQFKLTMGFNDYAFLSNGESLLLEKELVGPDIYRFRLVNPVSEDAYLCVARHGLLADYVNLNFTGNKDSQYAHFYLERTGSDKNKYYIKSIGKGQYIGVVSFSRGLILLCDNARKIIFSVYPEK
ncbi:hypothetical protein GZ449_001816 [Salmonella enterica]|nr:hypothetical protein [Salmonella enterica]